MIRVGLVVSVCLYSWIYCDVHALHHCEKTNIPNGLLKNNVINVVYTMDTSCSVCVQQASRLPQLKRYLEKKGIKTHLIIGTSHASEQSISGMVRHVQVNNRHIWRALGGQNNHFYVIDRCGRLVFEIINPFSNLNLPFVRSAVVATQHTHRCGLCPLDYNQEPKTVDVAEFPELTASHEFIPDDKEPIRMIFKRTHRHKGDPKIYKSIVRIPDVPNYHGHLLDDGELPNIGGPLQSTTEETTDRNRKGAIEVITEANVPIEHTAALEKTVTQRIPTKENPIDSINEEDKARGNTTGFEETTLPRTTSVLNLKPKESIKDEDPAKEYRSKVIKDKTDQVPPDKTVKNERLTREQLEEKQALLNHYKHILDWIHFSNDYGDID